MIVSLPLMLLPTMPPLPAGTNAPTADVSFGSLVASMPSDGANTTLADAADRQQHDAAIADAPAVDFFPELDVVADLVATLGIKMASEPGLLAIPAVVPRLPQIAPAWTKQNASGLPVSLRPVNISIKQDAVSTSGEIERKIIGVTANLPLPAVVPAPVAAILPTEPATMADAIGLQTLDLSGGDAWLDGLANDIAATAAPGGRLRFVLVPATLGRLDVEIARNDTAIGVHLAARNDSARDILTAAQPRLVEEIRAHVVRIATVEISAELPSQGDSGRGARAAPPARVETASATVQPATTAAPGTPRPGRYA